MKRTALTRSTPLRRTTPLAQRQHMRPVSDKRRAENRERAKVTATLPDYCEARHAPEPCYGPLTPHEIKPRGRGGSITDRDNIASICAHHNTWLSQSVEGQRWGYEHGLLRHSWDEQ